MQNRYIWDYWVADENGNNIPFLTQKAAFAYAANIPSDKRVSLTILDRIIDLGSDFVLPRDNMYLYLNFCEIRFNGKSIKGVNENGNGFCHISQYNSYWNWGEDYLRVNGYNFYDHSGKDKVDPWATWGEEQSNIFYWDSSGKWILGNGPDFLTGVSVKGEIRTYNRKNAAKVELKKGGVTVDTLTLTELPAGTQTQFNQSFEFQNVTADTYDIVVTKAGHLSYTIKNVVVGDVGLDLTKNSNANIKLMTLVAGNADNVGGINIDDLSIVVSNFGKTTGFPPGADIDGNGGVNIDDLNLVVSNFGKMPTSVNY